jgi:hypothetical protein
MNMTNEQAQAGSAAAATGLRVSSTVAITGARTPLGNRAPTPCLRIHAATAHHSLRLADARSARSSRQLWSVVGGSRRPEIGSHSRCRGYVANQAAQQRRAAGLLPLFIGSALRRPRQIENPQRSGKRDTPANRMVRGSVRVVGISYRRLRSETVPEIVPARTRNQHDSRAPRIFSR